MTGRSRAVDLERFRANLRKTCADRVAVEEPLEIRVEFLQGGVLQNRSVSVTMLAPGEALFSYTLFGRSGTERVVPLSPQTCPQAGLRILAYVTSACGG